MSWQGKKPLARIQSRKFRGRANPLSNTEQENPLFAVLHASSTRRVCRNQLLFRGLFAAGPRLPMSAEILPQQREKLHNQRNCNAAGSCNVEPNCESNDAEGASWWCIASSNQKFQLSRGFQRCEKSIRERQEFLRITFERGAEELKFD